MLSGSNVNNIFGTMYAKCKIVNANGHSNDKSSNEAKTANVTPSSSPDFKEKTFFLKASDQSYVNAEHVRIEIFVEYFTSNTSIGAIFIPFHYFQNKGCEYSFPVVKFRQSNTLLSASSVLTPSLNNSGLGELSVRVNRVEEDSSSRCKIRLRTTLRESHLFNTLWYGECLLAGERLNCDNMRC
jgi:hypothetical protein